MLYAKKSPLQELEVYKISMVIGEIVWSIVAHWPYFEKKTLGSQFVEAADSIALNISEGYGRFHYKENIHFCYYSRGSAKESQTITHKAKHRNLITEEEFQQLTQEFDSYSRMIFGYIKSIGTTGHTD